MLVGKYEYSAYGKCTILLDTDKIATINPFRFKCYYYDRESGMYYCHTRYFVPEWGRWLNADHFAYLELDNINGMNLFAYCSNDPIMYFDINGYSWNSFWNGVGNWFKGVGNSIKGFFVDDVYGGVIKPSIDWITNTAAPAVGNFFTNTLPNFFTNTIPDFFENTVWKDWIVDKVWNNFVVDILWDKWLYQIYKFGIVPAGQEIKNFFTKKIPDFFVNTVWNGYWKDLSENKAFDGLLSIAGFLSIKANPIVGGVISVMGLLLWFRTCFD